MIQTGTTERRAFNYWLRTGRQLASPAEPPVEFKFNPYHDPRNGQFTFAPGGARSLDRVIVSKRGERARSVRSRDIMAQRETGDADGTPLVEPAVYRPGVDPTTLKQASSGNRPPPQRGSNSAAFRDPMTLEHVFPRLWGAPSGSMLALADNVLDFSGKARELTSELALKEISYLIRQVQAIDPNYRF